MAASILKCLAAFGLLAAAAAAPSASIVKDTQLPIMLDAQSGEVDLKTGNEIFHKVRISQGDMVITAEQAQASQPGTKLSFDNSLLVFRGTVKITTDQGLLTADEAQITFVNNVFTKAVATGKPAAFEQRIVKSGKQAKGNAETIDYDVARGMVRFTTNAFLSLNDPQFEIRGQTLKYDAVNQKVIAPEEEQGSQRIHSIFTPPPPKTPPKSAPPPANPTP
ncbi:MAG TPA: lipopolysaccharide transport periplasmic protein LptA [Steroidobacteraceae bacterium]